MRSPRSAKWLASTERAPGPTWAPYDAWKIVGLILGLAVFVSCATSVPPPPQSRIPTAERAYLVDPLEGYPLTADPELELRASRIFAGFGAGADLSTSQLAVEELAKQDPNFHPATVLLAQIAFLRQQDRRALDLSSPVADELPGYVACQLLRGRAAERSGDLALAYDAFASVARVSPLATRRRDELGIRAAADAFERLREAVELGRLQEAEEQLALLRKYEGQEQKEMDEDEPGAETGLEPEADLDASAPEVESQRILEARLLIAAGRQDEQEELEILRSLIVYEPERRELAERLGDLELEQGRPRAALAQLEALLQEHPDDPDLLAKVGKAKFLWRLQQLPVKVQELSKAGELSRADLASLLYWIIPEVRYAQVNNPPIATDILDDPQREEIVRVVNLGLIDVDEALHLFRPTEPADRALVFSALLGLLEWVDQDFPCLASTAGIELSESRQLTCAAAAACGLIPEPADCLPAAPISGAEAIDFFRRTLDLLGAID